MRHNYGACALGPVCLESKLTREATTMRTPHITAREQPLLSTITARPSTAKYKIIIFYKNEEQWREDRSLYSYNNKYYSKINQKSLKY